MRDVVLYSLLSLDGVAEEPGDWMFEADDEVFRNLAEVITTQDDVLLGHGTYDYWSGYWPTSEVQPFADFVNTTTKHVFARAPLELSWPESRLADAPLEDYVRRLASTRGGDIGVHGSIEIGRALLAVDLVDRLELVVVPTLAGKGRRLLGNDDDVLRRLELTKAERSSTGCVFLGYERAH